ncbi:MAG TPA: M24 family metallopeptidase [Candidatus Acidoferrales bacterium]|nr:M24 family metallopeptidase [Candidatus Acidoferrales bacterium]
MDTTSALLDARRARAAAAWNLTNEVVLIEAGGPISIPGGADQTYPFLAHAEYFWLTDHEPAGAVLAFDPKSGWTDFVPETTEAERVWEGRGDAPGTPRRLLEDWLAGRADRPVVRLGAALPNAGGKDGRALELREALTHARRPKDAAELARLRAACDATAGALDALAPRIRAGVSERTLQIELETEFFRRGADRTGYGTIVGAGSNSAVLHFTPGARVLRAGDSVLIDAGAEVRRYTADITRTYRAPGGDAGFFRALYAAVLTVEERAVARCVRGAEWRDVHLEACRDTAAALVELGILKGEPDALVERDAHALFFPHGLGHMVGLGVRDASGYLPGRKRSERPGLNMLRTDLPLERDYVITVEPGIYFVPALLRDPERRRRFADCVDFSRAEARFETGGVRIEDNVRITDGAPEVLTAAAPKSLESMLLG